MNLLVRNCCVRFQTLAVDNSKVASLTEPGSFETVRRVQKIAPKRTGMTWNPPPESTAGCLRQGVQR
jgi:hypothetical protein